MRKILPLIILPFLAAPVFATWSWDGADGGNYYITDGTWRIKIMKNGNSYYLGPYTGGGPTLDLSTVAADLAAEPTPHTVSFSSVGGGVFQNNTTLVTLILPDFCTTISASSFNGCTSLETVHMPGVTTFSGATAFGGCTKLATVDCPNLKSINGYGAFSGCTSLKELKVAANMTSFSTDTVRGCTSFTTLYTNEATKVEGHVQLPPGVTSLGNYNFYQTKIVRIDAPSVTSIGGSVAFSGCTLLKEAHFPKLASMSGTAVFSGCAVLERVEISSALAGTIGNQNFNGCTSLESVYQSGNEPVVGLVDLPAGVTKIDWAGFQNCKVVEHIVAPGVTEIRNRAFLGCTGLQTAEFSPSLSVLHDDSNWERGTFVNCSSLVHFFPSTIPNITELRMSIFRGCSSLTNAFDFSGATLSNVNGSHFFNGAAKVPCVRLPASFPNLGEKEFYNMAPGAELHFAGDIPAKRDSNKNDQLYAGKNGADFRYKIFVDAENFPAWTNGTVSGATFTPKTAAMEDESDYPGIATLGFLNYASNGQNNWLVQEPFYVDVTFYDENGTTVLDVVKTLLGAAPSWTNAAPTKASSAQYDYAFAGWSTDGSTVVDLSTLRADGPMSLRAVYTPVLRSYDIVWQWFDGTAAQSDTTTVDYGETPAHAAVEQAPSGGHTYTFLGWSTDGSTVLASIPSVTGPATYVAVFEEKDAALTVTVRWLDDDGTTVLATTWPDAGTAAVAPVTPSKESTVATNFAFAGWSTDGVTVLTDFTVSDDTDFIAVYTASVRRYAVTFANWDGSVVAAADYDYGTSSNAVVVPPDPTRPATPEYTYAFAGWDAPVSNVVGAATYTATYDATANVYAATFVDGLDGSTILGPTNYAYGTAVEAPAAPEHYGYAFAAWSPAVGTMPAADTTYTATYSTNRYTLTWQNGDAPTTAKYDYLTPTNAIAVPGGSKTSTSKYYYKFREWTPALEPVQSNTTYTAQFEVFVGRPMKLALGDVAVADDHEAITVSATLSDFSAAEAAPAAAVSGVRYAPGGRTGDIIDGTAAVEGNAVEATLSGLSADGGYDWEIVAMQDVLGNEKADRVVLRGRSYAKRHQVWFEAADVVWTNGLFTPAKPAAVREQIRIRSAISVPDVPPRVHVDATDFLVGLEAFEASCGDGVAWHAWDGAKWIRLEGAVPPCGGTATVLTVVDFATKTPTATWYVDGLPLTTADGEWAIPLAGGTRLSSFADAAGLASSLWADYDLGAPATMLLIR
ncbi:MAG: leucine-rich repeat protein [Kiritimatiellae bacterium]|nr:leucine-rich repeat protein [Kiritimatiellia bacterium]